MRRLIVDLSQVSRTAILLLICRAVEAERDISAFNDPMAVLCLDRLMSVASDEDKRWMIRHKRMYEGVQGRDARAGVRRVQAFDDAANRFIAGNPGCTVINLACGFDTRVLCFDMDSRAPMLRAPRLAWQRGGQKRRWPPGPAGVGREHAT